jgi:type IV secretion system protein TrbB
MQQADQSNSLAEQKRKLVREKLVRELGATVRNALDDPNVVEIMLNADGKLWIDVLGEGMHDTGDRMSPLQAENLIGTIGSMLDTVVDREHPLLQGELPLDGSRVQAVLPPIVSAPIFAIRKKAALVYTFDDYIKSGILAPKHRDVLVEAAETRKNLLIVGSTGSGKTTLANAMLHEVARCAGSEERIVIIEDTVELQCAAPNAVAMRTSDDVDTTRCLKIAMRLRPDRIVVGEVRDRAAQALLKAWNTGHPGGLCTVHANSAAAGLLRLEQLISEDSSATAQPQLIAEAVDLIAFIERTKSGRRVSEMLAVRGYRNGQYQFEPIVA